MAVENRSNAAGAINAPPSNSDTYTSRGVFNNTGTSAGVSGTSGSSTSETTLNPSTGTGGGGNANDTTITLSAGIGIDGGGDFTTNQADAETITFNLGNAGAGAATYNFDSTNILSSLEVDAHGRVLNVTGSSVTPPNPFNDNLQTTSQFAGGPVPARTGGVEVDTPVTATVSVDPTDYDITDIMATGTNVNNIVATIDPTDTSMATITGTVPANTVGPVNIMTETEVTRESTGAVETQTSTPLSTTLYVPFYRLGPTTMDIDFTQPGPIDISSWTEAGTNEITSGTMIMFDRAQGATGQQQMYWALEDVQGRTYMQSLGFGTIDFNNLPELNNTGQRLGRTFRLFKWYSNGNEVVEITF